MKDICIKVIGAGCELITTLEDDILTKKFLDSYDSGKYDVIFEADILNSFGLYNSYQKKLSSWNEFNNLIHVLGVYVDSQTLMEITVDGNSIIKSFLDMAFIENNIPPFYNANIEQFPTPSYNCALFVAYKCMTNLTGYYKFKSNVFEPQKLKFHITNFNFGNTFKILNSISYGDIGLRSSFNANSELKDKKAFLYAGTNTFRPNRSPLLHDNNDFGKMKGGTE